MRLVPVLLLVAATPVAAQQLPPSHPRYTSTFARTQTPPLIQPGDYAWEGAKVGAVIFGLPGIGVGYALCGDADNGHPTSFAYCAPRALIGGLIGATLGAVVGGYIGSTIHRDPETAPPQ
ncbi:MAG TPA: hypothetical protein VFU75_00470 [Gemmatimonadales bacterium]|nr:hypothetical protein [Gemmatimonadales bacterium]